MEPKVTYDHSITELGHIQVRKITRIMEGDTEITRLYHRHVLKPGDDVSNEDDRTKVLAATLWDAEFVTEYTEAMEDGIITEEEKASLWDRLKGFFS